MEFSVAVLDALERIGPYVVPGDNPEKPRHDLKRPWDAVTKRAGLTGVRLHDLRHTYASLVPVAGWACRSSVGCLGTLRWQPRRDTHISITIRCGALLKQLPGVSRRAQTENAKLRCYRFAIAPEASCRLCVQRQKLLARLNRSGESGRKSPRPLTDCHDARALRFENGDDLVRARVDDEDLVAD